MSEPRPVVVYPPGEGIWLSFHGSPSRIIATTEQTGGEYCVSIGSVLPGGAAPPHSHTFGEGFWVSEGEMSFTAGKEEVTLPAGSFIHIEGGTAHFPTNRSDVPAELITICAPGGFDQFQLAVGEPVENAEGPFPRAAPDIADRMKAAAPEFGIDLSPDPSRFEEDPEISVRHPEEGDCIGVVGDVYRFLVKGGDTGGKYALWHATIYPGGGPPPHRHSKEEEFFYVLSGEVTIFDDGESMKATPGTAVVLPRGSRHWFKNESGEEATMLILVAPAGLEEMFFRTGREWSVEKGNPGGPQPDEIETLKEIAPGYGIELG